jgi:hypothetical protein
LFKYNNQSSQQQGFSFYKAQEKRSTKNTKYGPIKQGTDNVYGLNQVVEQRKNQGKNNVLANRSSLQQKKENKRALPEKKHEGRGSLVPSCSHIGPS